MKAFLAIEVQGASGFFLFGLFYLVGAAYCRSTPPPPEDDRSQSAMKGRAMRRIWPLLLAVGVGSWVWALCLWVGN